MHMSQRLGALSLQDRKMTEHNINKPVGDWISAPIGQMSLPLQQGSAPQHFARFHWIGHPRKPPSRPIHLRSICHANRLIGDFVQLQIWRANFGRQGAQIKNRRTTFCRVPHGELTVKKWLDSMEKYKRRINLKFVRDRQTDRRTDRQTVNDKK